MSETGERQVEAVERIITRGVDMTEPTERQESEPRPGTWAHTVEIIKATPIGQLRAEIAAARSRRAEGSE